MAVSRRKFLATVATASGAMLAAPQGIAAPYQVTVHREGAANEGATAVRTGSNSTMPGGPVVMSSSMPMGLGAPLGGIGTGFVEIRPDGCFYEWQIFNSGAWAQNVRSTTAAPRPGPQYLRFVLHTRKATDGTPRVRRLYLRSDESDNYSLPFVQDVESIDYSCGFPMTELRYNDPTIPVYVGAEIFSPFIPGKAQESGTPGFHVAFTLENTSKEAVEVSLAGFMDNPLASGLPDRRLSNAISQEKGVTSLFLQTSAESEFPSGIGNMCLSVTGGGHSYISGTYEEYAMPGSLRWQTRRVNYMILGFMQEFLSTGRLPDTRGETDPRFNLPTSAEIDALSDSDVQDKIKELSSDALLARVFSDARIGNPDGGVDAERELLREVHLNLLEKEGDSQLTWGTGALASSVKLAPGQKVELRFTLSWYFPHHLTADRHEMGHMYTNWFRDAADVNRFLCSNFEQHRAATAKFARTLADTSLGDAMAFSWSSQLSTLVFNTWWTKDGGYAVWEGLGCCGMSTTDVDYQGSFPVMALFPELKLGQMKRIIAHQNSLGQVPHNYPGDLDRTDDGFARVDMNSQFVMMVYRDYLWTGDAEYLSSMWPRVVKAMAFMETLDTNHDGLPDRDTGFQSYDQWRMRGTPSYISSLWIGALHVSIRIAEGVGKTVEARRWAELLAQASASFDQLLFNGEYYNLWVDGKTRDELCMTDQVSGEWFTRVIGLPTTISDVNLRLSIDSIFQHNFNSEFGLHNATAPKRGAGLLALTNLQAGGLWSGIEFAFASFLMECGRYEDGVKVVEAIHRRYMRAGQPWNHVECGGHYARAMSSWATMLSATGFKPDVPQKALAILPAVQGDFRAPWVTASGYGTIVRAGGTLSLHCVSGALELKGLRVREPAQSVRIGARTIAAKATANEREITFNFSALVLIEAGQTLEVR